MTLSSLFLLVCILILVPLIFISLWWDFIPITGFPFSIRIGLFTALLISSLLLWCWLD